MILKEVLTVLTRTVNEGPRSFHNHREVPFSLLGKLHEGSFAALVLTQLPVRLLELEYFPEKYSYLNRSITINVRIFTVSF